MMCFPTGFSPGNFARVLSGPHLGLCGKVRKYMYVHFICFQDSGTLVVLNSLCNSFTFQIVSADEDNSRVCLRLAINGQVCIYMYMCIHVCLCLFLVSVIGMCCLQFH